MVLNASMIDHDDDSRVGFRSCANLWWLNEHGVSLWLILFAVVEMLGFISICAIWLSDLQVRTHNETSCEGGTKWFVKISSWLTEVFVVVHGCVVSGFAFGLGG